MKRKLATTFAVLGVLSAVVPASAGAEQRDVRDIVDDLIVCVMAPCP
jgi:hypothetical protein